jgi:hypothetical protein
VNSAEHSPWICPSCGHFCVRPTTRDDAPNHGCALVGRDVDLVPYIDSAQAMQIRDKAVSKAAVSNLEGASRDR